MLSITILGEETCISDVAKIAAQRAVGWVGDAR